MIKPEMWDDDWFGKLARAEKLYWVYLLTNQQTHASGLYQLSPRLAPALLGMSRNSVAATREKFTVAGKAYFESEWVFILNFIKHQPPPNESVSVHVVERVAAAPPKLSGMWLKRYKDSPASEIGPHLHTVLARCPDGVCTETETVQRQRLDCTETEKDSCAEPSEDARVCASPDAFTDLPLYEQDKKLCKKWHKLLASARTAYPGIDILAEVRKAHAWEVANPSRRKKDRVRFLNNWFSRAQDKPRQAEDVTKEDVHDFFAKRGKDKGGET